MSTVESPTVDNGVDVAALLGARDALAAAPDAAQFRWRARCEWVKGTHSRTTVHDFSGLGAEHTHRTPFTFEGDHPEVFASADHGATPTEVLLAALAGCLTAGIAAVATHRNVQLRSVSAVVEADHDIRGILGADPDVRNGFSAVRVRYEIDADAPRADVEAIVAQSQKRSAVYDILTNPTAVTVEVG
ncbi:OsmC family protein [Pseudonocardia sp.]|uniref:OsmC family protein n=1 Tax=Pseudonocardia sp. TaxID=60912 RepID=UPI002631566F|nr:OsmC family protein [Pseudonocardia sp.]